MSSSDQIINKKDFRNILNNLFSLTSIKVFSFALPLVTFPYLIRVLGVEYFGLIVFAQASMYYFEILVDFGFNLSATREVALNTKNDNRLDEIVSSVLSIKFLLLVLSSFFLIFIVNFFDRFSEDSMLYYFSFLKVCALAFFPIWFFQGIEKMKYIMLIDVISKSIFTILIFVFVDSESDYLLVPLISGLGYFVGSILALSFVFIKFNRSFTICSFSVLYNTLSDSSMFFLSRVSVSLYTTSNAFFLGLVTSNIMVGYYAIAEKLYMVLRQMYQPLVQVIYPYISKTRNIKFFIKGYFIIVICNFLLIYLLWFFASDIILLITREPFLESIRVFKIFLIVASVVVPSILLGYPFLAALGFKKEANYSTIFGSVFHLIILGGLYLTNKIDIYNIVYLLIFTEIIVFSYRCTVVLKNKLFKV